MNKLIILLIATLLSVPAVAQNSLRWASLGYCQMSSLSTATLITAANCTRGSFTATGSGTQLTVSSVTGYVAVGDQLAGTGVLAGTYIAAQVSGTPRGAGVYTTNIATTSSGASSLTSGGVPNSATWAQLTAESQAIRYRDDGGVPTGSVGMPVATGAPIAYQGTLSAIQIIEQTSSAKVNLSFYR